GEGLIEEPDDPGDQLTDVGLDRVLVVIATQALGHPAGIGQLIVRPFMKAYRAGRHWPIELGGHERNHATRVHAPAQKGPQRHIAAEPDADRLAKDLPQLVPAVLLEARALSVKGQVP